MWFQLDVNELSRNPKVYRVDTRRIVLKTDFRIELYKLWRSGDPEGIQRVLSENNLGVDRTGNYNQIDNTLSNTRPHARHSIIEDMKHRKAALEAKEKEKAERKERILNIHRKQTDRTV